MDKGVIIKEGYNKIFVLLDVMSMGDIREFLSIVVSFGSRGDGRFEVFF